MENKNNSNSKHTRRNVRQKVAIIGLSLALALSAGAAVTIPLVVKNTGGGGGGETQTVYKVSFETDGAEGEALLPMNILKGGNLNKPSVVKTGYKVEGWYFDSARSSKVSFPLTVNKDMTLYVKWVVDPTPTPTTIYTVNFNVDGGSELSSQKVPENEKLNAPSTTKTNYVVEGWYYESTWQSKVNFPLPVDKDMTLYVKWTESKPTTKTYTVSFESNGGSSVPSQTIIEGQYATEPVHPTKSGKDFGGWYSDEGLTTPFNFTTTAITADTKLYAKWSDTPVTTITATFQAGDYGTFAGSKTVFTQTFAKDTLYKNITKPEVTANDDYVHTGWTDLQGQTIGPETVMSSDFTIVASYENIPKKNTITISSAAGGENDPWDVTIKGLTTYTLLASEYDTYGKIWDSLPVATCGTVNSKIPTFVYWSKYQQTSTESSKMPAAIQKTDPITNGDKLYPVFSFESPATNVTLKVQLTGDQELVSGSLTLKATYKAGSEDNVTFGELNKPEIYEGTTKTVFSGYYKDASYNTAWPNDEVIDGTSTNIYIKMVEPITDPVITFDIDPAWTAAGHENIQWVGNKEIKISSGDKLCDLPVPSVYSDATVYPSAAIGFKTDYYFEGWYLSTDTATEKTLLQPGYKFTNSCTLYPKFGKKTNLVFQTYTTGATVTEDYKVRHLESDVWTDIVKPSTISMPENHVFIGWQGQTMSSAEPQMLDDTTKVSDLDKTGSEDPTTKTIVPISADMTTVNCHIFNFIETASDGTPVTLVGNKKVGILASTTELININNKLNKPLLPNVNESGAEINKGISFDNEWEITDTDPTGGATVSWTKLSSQTIAAGSENKTYWLRPVIIHNYSITFDAGTEGAIAEGSTNPVSVNPSTKFANMYKPEIVPESGKMFLYWADADGNKISGTQTFTANTTLYAVYDDADVAYTINLMVAQGDLDDETFPATKINDNNLFSVSIVGQPGEEHKFSEFATRTPTKPCHILAGWTTEWKENWEECELIGENDLVPSGSGLNLYAVFKPDEGNYHKITIAEPTSEEYFLEGDTTMYAKAGATADYIDSVSGQWLIKENDTIKFNSNVWAVGKKITGWTKSDGTALPTAFSEDIEVKPVLEDADPIYVSFKTSTDYTLSSTEQKPMLIHDKLSTYIAKTGWAPTATKTKATFNKWAIYNGEDEEPTPITEDLRVSGAITLVPQFMDESIFEGSSDPYYYDEDKKMWAAIKTFYDPSEQSHEKLGVYYQDGTEGEVNKSTFNYEIKFGSQMTKIPDYFMYGCTSWNNGGQPLYFLKKDATTSSLTEIGKNVMYGCTSFNQPINILVTSAYDATLKIGQNFMRGCNQFNQNITITGKVSGEKGSTNLFISDGFMFECNMFSKTLDISTWENFGYLTWLGEIVYSVDETNFYSCLSTTDKNCPSFTLKVKYGYKSDFQALFPNMTSYETSYPYRWTYRSITVTEPE